MSWIDLPIPKFSRETRRLYFLGIEAIKRKSCVDSVVSSFEEGSSVEAQRLKASLYVLRDLYERGWAIETKSGQSVRVRFVQDDREASVVRADTRAYEELKRNEQLRKPSVIKFLDDMERTRSFDGRFVSIFSLMRDGDDLADSLLSGDGDSRSSAIEPYIQFFTNRDRCRHTGLRMMDIWRYFRLTWTNQYNSVPGRELHALVRDSAAENHPIMGIFALSSSVVQIGIRDQWIGWDADSVVRWLSESPDSTKMEWLTNALDKAIKEIRVTDFLKEGLITRYQLQNPTAESIDRLIQFGQIERSKHRRFVQRSDFERGERGSIGMWRRRSETFLYRSKRAEQLSTLLGIRQTFKQAQRKFPVPKETLYSLTKEVSGRKAIAKLVRKIKSERVGIAIADISVCGAVAPYNKLIGGKLIAMLASSPETIEAYRRRYEGAISEIASSISGRPISRRPELVFLGTTSLYGVSSSQYNRIAIPKECLRSSEPIRFRKLGRSESFGSSQFSQHTVDSLINLQEQESVGVRVNNIFGEGVNPKFRKVRQGLDLLGFPAEPLLKHRRQRIVYGVSLVRNLRAYLLGISDKPDYLFDQRFSTKRYTEAIYRWWFERWASKRAHDDLFVEKLRTDSLTLPIKHGARVIRPEIPEGLN